MIISIPKPQRDEKGKIRGEFYPLQRAELLALRDSELARGPFYVHLCLRFENPWCDRPFSVSVTQFCKRWHVPESNFYRAVGKLQEMEILDWEPREVFFYWKSPTSESQFPLVGDSPSSESEIPTSESEIPTSESEIPTSESEIPTSENLESSKPLLNKASSDGHQQTIQTYSDLEKTLSDQGECEKLLEQEEDIKTEHLTSLFSKTKNNAQLTNSRVDNSSAAATVQIFPAIKYDAALGIKPPGKEDAHWTLIYDGGNTPWLEAPKGRQLCWNQAFLRWQGERWMQKYSKADIYEAIADFRASLLNNPERIINRWQEYQDHMTHHAVVAQVRLENGIELTQTEVKKLQTHHRAVEAGFSNQGGRDILASQQIIDVSALPASVSIDIPMDGKEMAENPQAYAPVAIAPELSSFWKSLASDQKTDIQANPEDIPIPTSDEMTAKIQSLSKKMTIGTTRKKQVEIPADEPFESTFARMRELVKKGNPWHRKQALDWAFDNCKQVRAVYDDKFKLAVDIELIEVDF